MEQIPEQTFHILLLYWPIGRLYIYIFIYLYFEDGEKYRHMEAGKRQVRHTLYDT